MKKTRMVFIMAIILATAFFLLSCTHLFITTGELKAKQTDSGSFKVSYSFENVPKAVDNGNVYLNGELIGSGSGSGTVVFHGMGPNAVFTLTTATITLSTIVVHIK